MPSLAAGGLIGVGLMAAVDEIVFHQLLAWHHFYDRSTAAVGLLSDGLLHTGQLLLLVGGFLWLLALGTRHALALPVVWGGVLVGAGLFQLVDGIIIHKVLRLHQIRYGVELLPYDLAWNLGGAAVLLAGAAVTRWGWTRRPGRTGSRP